MKYRGVVYDVGLRFTAGQPYSVEPFNSNLVKHDLKVIANDLHANTVRIEGEELSRLAFAAREAHAAGLKIFFNPWKMNVHVSELIEYFSSAAEIAETLRLRLTWMTSSGSNSVLSSSPAAFAKQFGLLNSTLTKVVDAVRSKFKGSITYSAGTWEAVDWSIFDIVGVDYYRNGEPAQEYIDGLDKFRLKKTSGGHGGWFLQLRGSRSTWSWRVHALAGGEP